MDTNNITDILSQMPDLDIDISTSPSSKEAEELIYIEGIDPRIKLLSHSSRSTLHKCPRKFQLYRLNATTQDADIPVSNSYDQLTFDFGHAVGLGIQRVLQEWEMDKIILELYLNWNVDPTLRNAKQSKSMAEAILAVQQFQNIVESGYLSEYELLGYVTDSGETKPAIELSFSIHLPGDFYYRGYMDVVLRHKETGEVVVLELKTTSYREVNPAQYKNSGQGLGYSVVLDKIVPGLSSYTVLYLVYSTTKKEYIELPFEKSSLQRALWLNGLLIDCKHIELYEAFAAYSLNGDFCYDFYRECEYLGLCTMSTERLVRPLTRKILDEIEKREVYDFNFEFEDLIQTQLEKNS